MNVRHTGHTSGRVRPADRLARVSTDAQDLTAQRDGLQALGVQAQRVYVDQGLTGTHRDRPGLREALAACRAGDTLVVTKRDRLARSLPDARDIVDDLTHRQVKLNLGGSVHDPTDPVGRLLFNVAGLGVAMLPRLALALRPAGIARRLLQPTAGAPRVRREAREELSLTRHRHDGPRARRDRRRTLSRARQRPGID